MKGISFVTDDKGKKIAVQIDLARHDELWEDIYDGIVAGKRFREPRESLESVKNHLKKIGKLDG